MSLSPLHRPGEAPAPGAQVAPEDRDRLRILLAIPNYPPVIGGAEMHVSRLAAALARRGHEVHVLTTYAPPMPRLRHWRDPNGILVTAVAHALPLALRPRVYLAEVALRLAVARPRYDMVELFLPGLHTVSGLAAARWRGTGSAVMFGSSLDVPRLTVLRFGRMQLAAIRRWADTVVVLNEEMRRDFVAIGVAEDRTAWLPCSVDISAFAPPEPATLLAARRGLQLPQDAFVIAFVGRLSPEKNLAALVRGIGRFVREGGRGILCVVGDGAERPALERAAAEGPAGSVRFFGERMGSDVAHVLQASDAFAMVSRSEGIPCALIEAMGVGLPCIVHDIPALAQLVQHGVHGLRIPVDDPDALHGAITALSTDPDLRHKMGSAGRALVVAEYAVDVVAARHERLYRRAVSAHRWA